MIHFTCEACGGVAPMTGICKTEGCNMMGNDLKQCDCENPMHMDKMRNNNSEATESQTESMNNNT